MNLDNPTPEEQAEHDRQRRARTLKAPARINRCEGTNRNPMHLRRCLCHKGHEGGCIFEQ